MTNGGSKPVSEFYIIPLDVSDRYIGYAPLRNTAVVLNTTAVNLLADLKSGISPVMEDKSAEDLIGQLKQIGLIDVEDISLPVKEVEGNPKPTHLTLFLTTACNLRCTYCYASAGDTPIENMELSTAKQGIDFVIKNARELGEAEISLAYHGGGEPSVNWKLLTASYGYAKKQTEKFGLNIQVGMASNGVLKTRHLEWIIENLNGCSISFDGCPSVQDKHRPKANGKGSSEAVENTIRVFDSHGFKYSIRVTVTADQIFLLPESIKYICSEFKPQRIQVEPAYQMGRWKDAPSAETKGFIQAYRKADAIARNYGQLLFFSAARTGTITKHFCGVSQDSFALTPGGGISACFEVFSENNEQAETFMYGNRENDGSFTFDLEKLNHLRSKTVDRSDFCEDCFAKWTCAGDCYHKNRGIYGDAPFSGSDRCHITRELTRDQIVRKIQEAGGIFWKESVL